MADPSAKPALLVLQPHLAPFADVLEEEFTVWRFWEGPPIEAVHGIRALVAAGEFPFDKALAESLPNLGLVAFFTALYDSIDLDWARGRGLKVSHSPGVDHDDVADHALGLVLAAWRRIAEGDRALRAGGWRVRGKVASLSLGGRRLGVVGLGAVGQAVARRAEAFALDVVWWGPSEKPDAPWARSASLLELARESDILVVACRAGDGTRGLIGREVLEALGPRGLLVNISRGDVVDESALVAALRDGRLGMAALDVFEEEPTPPERWQEVPNAVLTPHSAGATSGAVPRMAALTRENLRRFFAGEALANPVIE